MIVDGQVWMQKQLGAAGLLQGPVPSGSSQTVKDRHAQVHRAISTSPDITVEVPVARLARSLPPGAHSSMYERRIGLVALLSSH